VAKKQKNKMKAKIRSSAPGRICLFGEHQDYLGFPVIAAAIDLRMTIEGEVSTEESGRFYLELPDIGKTLEFNSAEIEYTDSKDYLKSTVNVLKKKNLYIPQAVRARFSGNVPIQAGASSSAALSVAWTGFLLQASKEAGVDVGAFLENPTAVAELAYEAEVVEFNESGGRMDQYTSAVGGIVDLDFHGGKTAAPLPRAVREFVLGDSMQPKDTQETLKRVRTAQEEGFRQLARHLPFKDRSRLTFEEAEPLLKKISPQTRPYLKAALLNRQITVQARQELLNAEPDTIRIAELMNRHQQVLREDLQVSTGKIDAMLDAALAAGALAGKINGSGEGGCMFALCPGKQQEVAEAIEQAGGVPYIINIGEGLMVKKILATDEHGQTRTKHGWL
jgi:galactokinase